MSLITTRRVSDITTASDFPRSPRSRLLDSEQLVGGQIPQRLLHAARPANFERTDLRVLTQAEVHALVAGGHEPHADRNVVVENPAGSRGQLQFGADGVPGALAAG